MSNFGFLFTPIKHYYTNKIHTRIEMNERNDENFSLNYTKILLIFLLSRKCIFRKKKNRIIIFSSRERFSAAKNK